MNRLWEWLTCWTRKKSSPTAPTVPVVSPSNMPAPPPPAPPPAPAANDFLKLGSRGDAVRELQTKLKISSDGVFGHDTETAVKIFQSKSGLTADGIVGPATWKALSDTNPGTVTQPVPQPVEAHPSDPFKPAPVVETPNFLHHEDMPTKGKYAKGYPRGLVVHYNAGAFSHGTQDAIDTIEWGKGDGFAFWCMAQNGTIVRGHPLTEWGYHCGASEWPGLGSSLSQHLLGLEMNNAGLLDANGKAWFGPVIPEGERRLITTKRDMYETPGLYHAYTPEQEHALVQFILWLKAGNPDVFNLDWVLGHHEISPNRKSDPGGSLSMGMPGLRALVKAEWAKIAG